MKKLVILFIFIFVLSVPVFSYTINGEVEYNVNTAREDILNTEPSTYTLPKNYIYDKNYAENRYLLLKGITDLKDRSLGYFSDGTYAIIYKDNPTNVLYYNPDGILTHNEIKDNLEYPYKTYKYDLKGKLVTLTLRVSEDETYIFNPDGELIAHWIGLNCYDENNRIIMTRKVLK